MYSRADPQLSQHILLLPKKRLVVLCDEALLLYNDIGLIYPKINRKEYFKTTNTYVSVKVLSDTYGIPKSTLYKAVKEGRLDYVKIGRSTRISEDSIRRYYVQKDRGSSSDRGEGESIMTTTQQTSLTGKGTIQKKKNKAGTVYYQVIKFPMGYDDDGNIVYDRSPCFKTREEAEQARLELMYKRKYNPIVSSKTKNTKTSSKSVSAYTELMDYVEAYIIPNYRNNGTKLNTRRQFETYFFNKLSKVTVRECTAIVIQKNLNAMNECRCPKTAYQILKRFFFWLKQQRRINQNPMEFVTCPKHVPKKKQNRSPLTAEEEKKLKDFLYSDDFIAIRHKALILVLLSSGLRPGEAAGLERCNIDWKKRVVRVEKTIGHSREIQKVRNFTKTPQGQRWVPISVEACEALKKYFSTRPDSPWVFTSHRDPQKYMELNSMKAAINAVGRRAGIKRSLFGYLFRHTFITNSVHHNIPAAELRFITGHKNTSMINEVYANHQNDNIISTYRDFFDDI